MNTIGIAAASESAGDHPVRAVTKGKLCKCDGVRDFSVCF